VRWDGWWLGIAARDACLLASHPSDRVSLRGLRKEGKRVHVRKTLEVRLSVIVQWDETSLGIPTYCARKKSMRCETCLRYGGGNVEVVWGGWKDVDACWKVS
jgi:hypothetical protein